MAIDDKICMVCGKHHKYCANDVRYNKDETWRNLYCSEECRKIFSVYKDIKDGKISGNDASVAAMQLGLPTIMSINEPMKSILLSYAKKIKTSAKPAEKPVVKAEPKTQPKTEFKAQPKQAQAKPKTNNGSKPNNNKRRNNKPKND